MSLDRTAITPAGFAIDFKQKKHDYFVEGEKYPSVTGIVDEVCAPPFGIPSSWGHKVAVWGLLGLEDDPGTRAFAKEPFDKEHPDLAPWLTALKDAERTPYYIGKEAADRGTDLHVAAARWAEDGILPDPLDYPEEQMGYVRALEAWLTLVEPEPLGAEEIVASRMLGYAGTLDLRCKIDGRIGIVDYKTTTSIRHPSHDYQLAGYELASQESGYDPTDFQAILRLCEDGTWEWYETQAETFIVPHLVAVWYENKRLNEQLKKAKKAAKEAAKT